MIGALDEYGYYVFGEDAIARKDYFCPNCDGPMRTRPSPKGLIHFFGRNGAHTEAGCAELTRILEAFDPRKFGFGAKLAQLLRSPGLPPDGPGGGPGGGNNGGNRVPILKLLWVAGLQYAVGVGRKSPLSGRKEMTNPGQREIANSPVGNFSV